MARLRIGLIGWGTVGSALGRLVAAGPLPLELACLAVRDPAATRSYPLPDGVAVVAPEDVAGRDAAQKLAILASEAWGQWRSESQVERHGMRGLEVTEGQVIRLVAEATEQTLAVAPQEVERGSALGATSGIDNVLEIEVRAGGIFRIGGPGAGGRVTAGAVYADLARLVSGERPILFGGKA